jgi:hypothetical protein
VFVSNFILPEAIYSIFGQFSHSKSNVDPPIRYFVVSFCVGITCGEDVAQLQVKLEMQEVVGDNFKCAVSSAFVSSIVSASIATSLATLFALTLW